LIQPTILCDFPTDLSPLSKQKPEDPSLTERFEIYVAGMGNCQRLLGIKRSGRTGAPLLAQMAHGGDEMPKQLDVDYVRALCYGLPPTAGEGIGIDRLTMVLTDSTPFATSFCFHCCGRKLSTKPKRNRRARRVDRAFLMRFEWFVARRYLRSPNRPAVLRLVTVQRPWSYSGRGNAGDCAGNEYGIP